MELILTNGSDKRFITLCEKLDNYLNEVIGGEKQKKEYNKFNTLEEIHDVVLAVEDGCLMGCGSFNKYNEDAAEIKRVFVDESFRHRGIGRLIMNKLENIAIQAGYKRLILETGKPLLGAQKMYAGLGYKVIENYGQYKDMSGSVCMEKNLKRFMVCSVMDIKEEDIESRDAFILINQLSDTLSKITGSSGKNSFNNDDIKNDRSIFVIGRIDSVPAGCGAIRELSDNTAELKRMYAVNKGRGTGKKILLYLENRAREFGYKEIILETRKCNKNAVDFYLRNNYKVIENYGRYKDRSEAVCFKKIL